jgi:alpha-glucosidase
MGTLNGGEPRTLSIPLTFLDPGRKYAARIYSDAAPDGTSPRAVAIQQSTVDSRSTLTARLAHNGGQAIFLSPAPVDSPAR